MTSNMNEEIKYRKREDHKVCNTFLEQKFN